MVWLIVLIAVLAVLALFLIFAFNRLVRLRNETESGWSNIDVQLNRKSTAPRASRSCLRC